MSVIGVAKVLEEIMEKYHQYGVEYFYIDQYSDVMREYDNEHKIKYDVETDDYKIDFKARQIYLL